MLSGLFGVARFIGVSSVFFRVIGVRPEVCSGSMRSLWCANRDFGIGSLGCALSIVGLVRGHWVHLGVPLRKSGLFGFAGFIGVCPGGHQDCSGSMGSLGCAVVSSYSFEVDGCIWVRCGGRPVRSVCLGSLGCAPVVVSFARNLWVFWEAHWDSQGSFRFAGFIGVRPGGRRVRSGLQDSFGAPLRSSGLFAVTGFISAVGVVRFGRCRSWGRRVRSRSLGSFRLALGVVGFGWCRWLHWDAPWGTSASLVVAWFIVVRPGDRQIRSGSLSSLGCALGIFGIVRGSWVH